MKPDLRLAIAVLLVGLGGCGAEKKQQAQGTAGGQVLEGTVSDAMLPVDQVSSQPPLAPRSEGGDARPGEKPAKSAKHASGAAGAEETGVEAPAAGPAEAPDAGDADAQAKPGAE